jgi:hypothetical protein
LKEIGSSTLPEPSSVYQESDKDKSAAPLEFDDTVNVHQEETPPPIPSLKRKHDGLVAGPSRKKEKSIYP